MCMGDRKPKIGVLCVQGGFVEHLKMVQKVGCEAVDVRTPEQLEDLDGLILPGGESTAIGLIAKDNKLIEPIQKLVHEKKLPIMGTCAGLIVLSNEVTDQKHGGQPLFGGLHTLVHRNGFGRQINSFESPVEVPDGIGVTPKEDAVFIRAPIVEEVLADDVKVVATVTHSFAEKCDPNSTSPPSPTSKKVIVGVQQGNLLGLSFHPELTDDTCWHEYFKKIVQAHHKARAH